MWNITDDRGALTTVESILAEYPDAVAYDESGREVDLTDLDDDAEQLADAGYGTRDSRRILIWEDEAESKNDDGARAIASATWID